MMAILHLAFPELFLALCLLWLKSWGCPGSPLLLQGEPYTQGFTLVWCRQAETKCRNPCLIITRVFMAFACAFGMWGTPGYKSRSVEVGMGISPLGKENPLPTPKHSPSDAQADNVRHVLESTSAAGPWVPHSTVKLLFKHTLPPFPHALRSISPCRITR